MCCPSAWKKIREAERDGGSVIVTRGGRSGRVEVRRQWKSLPLLLLWSFLSLRELRPNRSETSLAYREDIASSPPPISSSIRTTSNKILETSEKYVFGCIDLSFKLPNKGSLESSQWWESSQHRIIQTDLIWMNYSLIYDTLGVVTSI
jgi:hypothetical protein